MKGLLGSDFMLDPNIILESAKTGNADSFGVLYEKYAKEIYLYAYKYLGNREDAEDAVQQASVNVYKNIKSIKNADSFKAYYFKAVSNTCKTMLSKKKLHIVSTDEADELSSNDTTESSVIEKSTLENALAKLNDEEREIVLLSVISGFSSKEIAKITNLTHGSVRSKLSRALNKLRVQLGKDE